jgi:hypothetical protein
MQENQMLKLICEIPRGAQSLCFTILANVIATIILYKFFGKTTNISNLVLCSSIIVLFVTIFNGLDYIIDRKRKNK